MTDASLPDRVEAADPRVAALVEVLDDIMLYEGCDIPSVVRGSRTALAKRLLRAADACEAERNPNPTDALRPNQIANASLDFDDLGQSVNVIYADHGEIKTMPWMDWREAVARAVSSEDVHREAAE